jgi:hypothetical protein
MMDRRVEHMEGTPAMNNLTKQTIKAIEEDITAALVSVGEKHGVKLSMGRGSFSPQRAKVIVNVAAIGESGETYTPYADDLKQYGTELCRNSVAFLTRAAGR